MAATSSVAAPHPELEHDQSIASETKQDSSVGPGDSVGNAAVEPVDAAEEKPHYGWRFWLIFPALCATAFLASLEATLVSTALPTINRELDTGDNYVWVINAFFLTRYYH